MLIFSTEGVITPADDKTNIRRVFTVPENIRALKIKYRYSPKTLEDREKAVNCVHACFRKYSEEMAGVPADFLPLKNLITLSLDCGSEYIGAAHRQSNNQEHIISADFSSPGFVKCDIRPGEWDIILNVHCVLCDVKYTIEIEGENEE